MSDVQVEIKFLSLLVSAEACGTHRETTLQRKADTSKKSQIQVAAQSENTNSYALPLSMLYCSPKTCCLIKEYKDSNYFSHTFLCGVHVRGLISCAVSFNKAESLSISFINRLQGQKSVSTFKTAANDDSTSVKSRKANKAKLKIQDVH